MVPETLPLQFGGFPLLRLFGLLFVIVGALGALRPREMATYRIRSRRGGPIEGTIEPTDTRILLQRVFGGFFVLVGLAIVLGVVP